MYTVYITFMDRLNSFKYLKIMSVFRLVCIVQALVMKEYKRTNNDCCQGVAW